MSLAEPGSGSPPSALLDPPPPRDGLYPPAPIPDASHPTYRLVNGRGCHTGVVVIHSNGDLLQGKVVERDGTSDCRPGLEDHPVGGGCGGAVGSSFSASGRRTAAPSALRWGKDCGCAPSATGRGKGRLSVAAPQTTAVYQCQGAESVEAREERPHIYLQHGGLSLHGIANKWATAAGKWFVMHSTANPHLGV